MVGDDIRTDIQGAQAVGIPVLRVLQGQYKHEEPSEDSYPTFRTSADAIAYILRRVEDAKTQNCCNNWDTV